MKHVSVFLIFLILSSTQIFATEYFVNSISGNDSNTGTGSNTPWKSIAKVEYRTLQPGDVVNLARGSSWSKSAWETVFLIDDSGTKTSPITFRAYGEGALPNFSNGGQVWNKGIKITGDYIVIENLKVTNTGYGGFELAKGADYNIIRNCEVSNCGMGILCYGSNNLFTENYIHDLKMVVDNEIPDSQSGGGDFGCVSFWLYGPKNEISYNRSVNNRGHSYDYKYDGGFLEFYENCDSTYAHHNWVENGCGIMEASNGHADNVVVSYNVFIEHLGMFAPHYALKNFRFENNTCITREGTTWNDMLMNPAGMVIRNNIFVFGGKSSERVATTNNFTHTNNLYYLLDGAKLGSLVLSAGEKLDNPLFVDETNKDFRLKPESPAKDAGASLGYKLDFSNKPVPSGNAPDMGAFEFDLTSGLGYLKTLKEDSFFSVYPNPAENGVKVDFTANTDEKIKIDILNLLGQKVFTNTYFPVSHGLTSLSLDLNISKGTYFMVLNNGNEKHSEKLVIN
jgi:parallel beta-helix repeat protein